MGGVFTILIPWFKTSHVTGWGGTWASNGQGNPLKINTSLTNPLANKIEITNCFDTRCPKPRMTNEEFESRMHAAMYGTNDVDPYYDAMDMRHSSYTSPQYG